MNTLRTIFVILGAVTGIGGFILAIITHILYDKVEYETYSKLFDTLVVLGCTFIASLVALFIMSFIG